jgi:hypothetical protein
MTKCPTEGTPSLCLQRRYSDPMLEFGTVGINSAETRCVRLRNPSPHEQSIVILNLREECGFSTPWSTLTLGPLETTSLNVTWQPLSTERKHHTVKLFLEIDGRFRIQITCFGTVLNPLQAQEKHPKVKGHALLLVNTGHVSPRHWVRPFISYKINQATLEKDSRVYRWG